MPAGMVVSELGCGACSYGSGTEEQPDQGSDTLPVRPEFPPPSLQLIPAFAPGLDAKLGADMLQAWTFLHCFGDLLGLPAATLDDLLAAGERLLLMLLCCSIQPFLTVQHARWNTLSPGSVWLCKP